MAKALTLPRPLKGLTVHAERLPRLAARLWRAYPRETVGLGVLSVIVAAALGGAAHSMPEAAARDAASGPPAPPPLVLRQVAPDQAVAINYGIPLAGGPNPAAKPFKFVGGATARSRALECLASAIYYEAGSQDENGERAVAQVVLNRVRHPAFPGTVCDVVYQGSTRPTGCQFTFTCDGSLYRQPDLAGWRRAYRVAQQALAGLVFAPVGNATHYHANYVVPYWAPTLAKNAVVGDHIFYRWAGGWGRPAAFTKRYAGGEPNATALRHAALAAEALAAAEPDEQAVEVVRQLPGAELQDAAPGRVAIRFNIEAARKASDEAVHEEYVKKFAASDNLKWSLSNDVAASDEKPLGRADPAAAAPAGSATGQR
ncbi:MAG TPA: cell wall hydrolase [Sphingomicrobium sp.]|nr:cell wall hydrolase [Sphingomicrobium sp.]